jgi:hypothetical protein
MKWFAEECLAGKQTHFAGKEFHERDRSKLAGFAHRRKKFTISKNFVACRDSRQVIVRSHRVHSAAEGQPLEMIASPNASVILLSGIRE